MTSGAHLALEKTKKIEYRLFSQVKREILQVFQVNSKTILRLDLIFDFEFVEGNADHPHLPGSCLLQLPGVDQQEGLPH